MRMSVFWLFRVLTTQLRWVHHEFVIFAVKRLELPSDNWHLQNIQSHSTRAQAFRFGMNMCVCTCACVHVSLFRCSRGSVCAFVCILLWFWKLQSFHLLIHSFIPIILGGFFALQSKLTFLNKPKLEGTIKHDMRTCHWPNKFCSSWVVAGCDYIKTNIIYNDQVKKNIDAAGGRKVGRWNRSLTVWES